MFKKNRRARVGDDSEDEGYALPWPSSDRWNPNYSVPRNSVDNAHASSTFASQLEKGPEPVQRIKHHDTERSMSWGRTTRDMDTKGGLGGTFDFEDEDQDEFSNLTHWLETLAELYMNELDNRARWDPRWLNITRRERFEGLRSASVKIIDYLNDDTVKTSESLTSKTQLASTLQARPEDSEVRVIMVTDLSRFVVGALGQMYAIDPEFWFEHLVNSGYGASDSGLKLKNAVWLNWAERETRFRHRALPGTGQRTEWNSRRRVKDRCWTHIRWGRLGLLHYLGRIGYHEDEMEKRLVDGRYLIERDVALDKYGLLMTTKRQARKEKRARKQAKKKSGLRASDHDKPAGRSKTSNVYRPYSTFGSLPKNPQYWRNRDLRVLAPEGISCWSNIDEQGKKIGMPAPELMKL